MKPFLLLLLLSTVTNAIAQEKPQPITLAEVQQRAVAGKLGLELGTVCEVEGTIFAGRTLRIKKWQSYYLLKVLSVNGVALQDEPLVEFSVFSTFERGSLPTDAFQLSEMKTGNKARTLDDDQIKKLEKGYVGSRRRLIVYETGQYEGVPANMPEGVSVPANVGLAFPTNVVVLKELPLASKGK